MHEIENGADMDAHDEDSDLQNYLLFQHLNSHPAIVADQHLQVFNGADPNDSSYYMNGHQSYPSQEEALFVEEDEDRKPEIKQEIIAENEQLQDISLDKDFKEDDEGRVSLSVEYIKCEYFCSFIIITFLL